VKLFIDECLSPQIAARLNQAGDHIAEHPRDYGGLGKPDYLILRECVDRDFICVTANGKDFTALATREDIHPGLIILPCVGLEKSVSLLNEVIVHLESLGNPDDVMVNHVLEIDSNGTIQIFELPVSPT